MLSWLRSPGFRFEEPPLDAERSLVLANGEAVPVRWVRDARARRLRLIVNERGVRLTVPRGASIRLAETFMFEHRDWIAEQLAKRPRVEHEPFAFGRDLRLPLRGGVLPIAWREGRYAQVARDGEAIAFTRPEKASDRQLRAALKEFYLQQARADLGAWLPKYLPGLPTAPANLRLRALSSLWGSLSASDGLLLDLSLVLGRPSAFEYVLVHELCHLLHRNHSRRFWREVEKRWPQWHDERDYLHGEGLALKAELRRLTLK
ncbi:MAG: SprT family zinc-dependent metalloprotease [Arenimonas sp.]